MNLTSLSYFAEAAKDMHITRTAQRLFLSQQNLSSHIARMEEFYGAKLFERRPRLKLTAAGEAVLAFAEEVGTLQKNLQNRLADIKEEESGRLRIGGSPLRLNSILPSLLHPFKERYPKVELVIDDKTTKYLEEMILNDELDIAIAMHRADNLHLKAIPLIRDQIYLCVADELLHACYPETTETIKERALRGAQIADFARLPFCMLDNRMGRTVEQCFAAARLVPNRFLTASLTQIGISVALRGDAACFANQISMSVRREILPANINLFPLLLHGEPVCQNIALITRVDRYLPAYARYLEQLFLDFFRGVAMANLARKAEPRDLDNSGQK